MGTEDIVSGRSNELIVFRTGQNRLSKLVKALVFVVCAVGPRAFLLPSSAQQIGLAASAPPEKLFIANAGGDFGGAPFKALRGGADRAYNEFFAAMKDWGRYEIVADPANADWIFEISVRNHWTCESWYTADGWTGSTVNDYRIELAMFDTKGVGARKRFHAMLEVPSLFGSWDRHFRITIAALLDAVKEEVGESASKTFWADSGKASAPVPYKIGSGKKVFIRNLGSSDNAAEKYSGTSNVAYAQLSAAIEHWGRYEVVSTAAQADLVFEMIFSAGQDDDYCGRIIRRLRLNIRDPQSGTLLWSFTTYVEGATLKRNARSNFARGIRDLVNQARAVARRPS